MKTRYHLKLFDEELLQFSVDDIPGSPDVEIEAVLENGKGLLPKDLTVTGEGLYKWLRRRTIPRNRAYVNNLLAKIGLSLNRPMGIVRVSKALSLNDCYWVTEDGFQGKFESYNLYQNRFSRILGEIAFTGYGSSLRASLMSSPEFTTNGMLPKCWRRERGAIRLWKGGTKGASNTGMEPYSEFYAAQIAEIMGISAIPYGLSKWKGELCSTCELFTDMESSYMPFGGLVKRGGFPEIRKYAEGVGEVFQMALEDMLVLDALLWNTDRHLGNFGILFHSRTNEVWRLAPLFDHGNSLFNYAGIDDWESMDALRKYAASLQPVLYDDFLGTARGVLRDRHRNGLRRLLDFHFKRHSRYNLPGKRLKMIEKMVQERAAELLR